MLRDEICLSYEIAFKAIKILLKMTVFKMTDWLVVGLRNAIL